ncbi:MAG TPA: hypothetical protein VNE63_07455 [Candidatus Acidoferrales bacterium]|nr:hypothetical protein [Candidatus Acidoferrales bacterium]
MAKKKTKKELDKEALSSVKREMAEPRMASSVREQETNQIAPVNRAGNG